MKAVVIGGGGILGLSLLVYLKEQEDTSKILVTDIREEIIKDRAAWLDDPRFSYEVLDASDYNSLVKTIKGHNIVLNTARLKDKTSTMKAALEAGAHYIDVGVEQIEEKLSLSDAFRKKELLAIIDMYYSPGLHNLLAAYAIERLDTVERVDFRWAVVDIVPASEHSRRLYTGFGLAGYILHHYPVPSRRWENGHMVELAPRAEPEMFTFKGPIGTTEVSGLPGDSMYDLAKLRPEIPIITFKEALGTELDRDCRLLVDLGFNQNEPIDINGQMVSPWAVLEHLARNQPPETIKGPDIRWGGCAIVQGLKDGQKTEYRVEAWPSESLIKKHKDMDCARFGGPGGVFRSGSPMGSVAVMIARNQITPRGVFLPEFTVPAKDFLKQEVSMGMNVEISKTTLL